jgi:hypothetical protein
MLRQRRVAGRSGLGTGLGATAKYLRRTRNGAAGNGLGATTKNLWQITATGNRLATTIKKLRGAAGIGLGVKIKFRAQCLCVDPELSACVHKRNPHHNIPFSFGSSK